MFKFSIFLTVMLFFSEEVRTSQVESETKKTYIEDVFIWKMSDELKLTVKEEKKFTEISRTLNRKKSELNKKIYETVQGLSVSSTEAALKEYKNLILSYNQLSISEFDSMKQLLGTKNFINYLKIKNELTSKIKSLLTSEKPTNKKTEKGDESLPPPKVIIEK